MDKPIEQKARRRQRLKKQAKWAAIVLLMVAGFGTLRAYITPGVDRDDLRISTVERGDVMATISASGVVVPGNEFVISASFPSEVLESLAVAGAHVQKGDALLVLDARPLQVDIQDLEEKLALKENDRVTARLKLEQSNNEATGRYELRKIDLEAREAKHDRLSKLAANGLISKGELHEAELDVRRTSVELKQLEMQMENQLAANETELDRITLETAILQNQLDEKKRLLELTTVRAPRDGVLTWVLDEVGTSITQGMPVARVADLSRFRVEATLSDFYAQRLSEGLPAMVDVSGRQLTGRVQSVLPTVENGAMQLIVSLDEPAADGLRPQLRVEVDIITGQANNTLRLRKGLGLTGSGRQQLYRITEGRALRTPVQLGLSNRDYVEVLEGLSEGDEVIVSDNTEFKHLEALEVD